VIRIVPEANSDRDTIQRGLRKRWHNAIDVEFIEIDELKRQGSRAKFRHLVTSTPADQIEAL
jgi:hypothetical protein